MPKIVCSRKAFLTDALD